MTTQQLNDRITQNVTLGNDEAKEFLSRWITYVHMIDDVEDETTTPEFRMKLYIAAMELYTCNFFLKNMLALRQTVYTVTNLYADSLFWQNSTVQTQKQFADWARHAGAEMILAVAQIVGGYSHMRNVSNELRLVNWSKHHGEKEEL